MTANVVTAQKTNVNKPKHQNPKIINIEAKLHNPALLLLQVHGMKKGRKQNRNIFSGRPSLVCRRRRC